MRISTVTAVANPTCCWICNSVWKLAFSESVKSRNFQEIACRNLSSLIARRWNNDLLTVTVRGYHLLCYQNGLMSGSKSHRAAFRAIYALEKLPHRLWVFQYQRNRAILRLQMNLLHIASCLECCSSQRRLLESNAWMAASSAAMTG